MKILMVNKFLFPNGGSETYIFQLGSYLSRRGHEVQYFGMEHADRCVGNRVNAYTSGMDFHKKSILADLTYPFKTIYSAEARKKIRMVLEDFRPDVIHLNNFNYQLTPSILLEIEKWKKSSRHSCKIIYTAHDYQLVCPNHMLHQPASHSNCEECLGGCFINCLKNKCIHQSAAKSAVGAAEAYFWNFKNVYRLIDHILCCSDFMKSILDSNPVFASKTVSLHNFIEKPAWEPIEKDKYVLYFGRFSEEKGIRTLIEAAQSLPEIPFLFAGSGPLEEMLSSAPNIKNAGFVKGKALEKLIRRAAFSVYPSEWYENCPFSVMESLAYGTPVLGAAIGGIPELIRDRETGELFISGNREDLKEKILHLYNSPELLRTYSLNCRDIPFPSLSEYCETLETLYQ